MLIGYARVSTQDQKPQLQLDALKGAGCERIFEEKASGAQRERPALKEAIAFLREGGTLVVWKLDRLARSLRQLIDTIETLEERGIGLRSLTENIDTTTSGGKAGVSHLRGIGRIRAIDHPRADGGGSRISPGAGASRGTAPGDDAGGCRDRKDTSGKSRDLGERDRPPPGRLRLDIVQAHPRSTQYRAEDRWIRRRGYPRQGCMSDAARSFSHDRSSALHRSSEK